MTKRKFYEDCLFILHLNIARFRRERGWTQEQLAERAGISVRYIASLEAPYSHAEPSFRVLCQLAFALGVQVSDLTRIDRDTVR
ncbi:MAG: helix-turn-helix transcriptional regulator [Clostridiales bacterium]|nr:helix-turn-helix transcriptional regulator [Clostridiales bacterium]